MSTAPAQNDETDDVVPSSPKKQKTVLYIEDNEANIRLVERILQERPLVDVHISTTGRSGIDAARALRPDLILLDNRLPDATGTEVIGELLQSELTMYIPVVILTSDSEREIANRLRAAGATDFLAKPLDLDVFLSLIDRYLA